MKILIKFVLITLLITSCNTEVKRDGYVINGNAKGIYNGIRVYLKAVGQNNRPMDIDTAIVMQEKFTFAGKVIGPEMGFIYINSVKGYLPLIIENNEISIDVDKDNFANSKISGSKTNEALIAYNLQLKQLGDKRLELNTQLRNAAEASENDKVSALNKELADINSQMLNSPFDFVQSHGDNFYSLVLLENMVRRQNTEIKKVVESFNSLNEELKSSPKGIGLSAEIEETRKILEARANTEIGKVAPEFSAPTPKGNILSLNEVKSKGKVTLIDFWAAWCGPCRRENPNLVRIYDKYHDKGFEILGVSLDGNNRQPDPKSAWIKAIEDDNLAWPQVSNLRYFNGPIAKMYNIISIPNSYLLDAEGKIVAKNLRGQALEAKIAELLD